MHGEWRGVLAGLQRRADCNGAWGTAVPCCVLSSAEDGGSRLVVRLDDGRTVVCPQRCFRADCSEAPMRSRHLRNAMYVVDDGCWVESVGFSRSRTGRFMRVWGDSKAAQRAVQGGFSHMHSSGGVLYTSHSDGSVRATGQCDAEQRVLWRCGPEQAPINTLVAAGGFVGGLRLAGESRRELLVLSARSGRVLAAVGFKRALPFQREGERRRVHCGRPLALWPTPSGGFAAFCSTGDGILSVTDIGADRRWHSTFGTHVAGLHGDELCTYSRDAMWLSKLSLAPDRTVTLRHDRLALDGGIEVCVFSENGHIAALGARTRAVMLLLRLPEGGYRALTLHGHHSHPEGALFVGDTLVTACVDATHVWPLSLSGSHLRRHGVRASLYTRMLLLAFRRTCMHPVPQDVIESIVDFAVDEIVHLVPHHVI